MAASLPNISLYTNGWENGIEEFLSSGNLPDKNKKTAQAVAAAQAVVEVRNVINRG